MIHFALVERWHLSQKDICQMTLGQIKNLMNEGETTKSIALSREQQLQYVELYRKRMIK